eukprot:XP_001708767.1 Hypothetical protein GL50803_36663 [Giardia lamblia ATCC 50803]
MASFASLMTAVAMSAVNTTFSPLFSSECSRDETSGVYDSSLLMVGQPNKCRIMLCNIF